MIRTRVQILLEGHKSISLYTHISTSEQRKIVIRNQRGYQRTMFTVGPVHTWNHDRGLLCYWSTEPTTRHSEGSYRMPFQNGTRKVESHCSPRSPGGPQIETEYLVTQHT